MPSSIVVVALMILSWLPQDAQPDPASRLVAALAGHELVWKLSEPEEVRAILGAPAAEEAARDGGMEVRAWSYGTDVSVFFVRESGSTGPFVLAAASAGGRRLAPDPASPLELRTAADLAKLPPFTGLQNVDASRLDLRAEEPWLRATPFDTRTVWPAAERMPPAFDPSALLRDGKNPGLGLRALHARGVDGRGVTIGIIDQPLLAHGELGDRLHLVEQIDVAGVPPQMHGAAVTSLAAGSSVGVAPGASIAYVATAMWKSKQSNALYIQALERLLAWTDGRHSRVRIVSVSDGVFQRAVLADEWQALLDRAESQGVLVITCDLAATRLEYGLLKPIPGGNRETPQGYARGGYGAGLLVPGDGRTYASSAGAGEYSYAPRGGMSWGAPYLAGLAALALQVNPDLTPARIRAYLVRSASAMPYGRVVNPEAFVRLCREDPDTPPKRLVVGAVVSHHDRRPPRHTGSR